jgi:hypothetical protein
MNITRIIPCLCITLIGSLGCGSSDSRTSRAHVALGRGQKPPKPIRVDQAPPEVVERAEVTDIELSLPDQLPDLIREYRLKLIEQLPVISYELAEKFADTEIADLRRRYNGQDSGLRDELINRLHHMQPHYGSSTPPPSEKGRYPEDERPAK